MLYFDAAITLSLLFRHATIFSRCCIDFGMARFTPFRRAMLIFAASLSMAPRLPLSFDKRHAAA